VHAPSSLSFFFFKFCPSQMPFSFVNLLRELDCLLFGTSKNFELASLCFIILLLVDFSYLQVVDPVLFYSTSVPRGSVSEILSSGTYLLK
jgi:hypothetical protein